MRKAAGGFLVALTTGFLVPAGRAADAAALPPAISLDKVAAADLKGWSDVQADGDIRYRAAQKGDKGVPATLRLRAWWDAGRLRPPEGQIVVMTVRYKDTVRSPAVFFASGWLAPYGNPSEVGRFGGSGDGQWKNADLPVSWDMLIRLPKERDYTSVGIRASADLPVAGIAFRTATPADEAAWNANTRAWVAAEAAGASAAAGQPAMAPEDLGAGPVAAFPWPVSNALLPTSRPKKEWIGKPVKIRMCQNEFQPGTFGVHAGADLKDVEFTVGPLTGQAGTLQAEITRRTAEYAPLRTGESLYPVRLWPAYKTDIAAGRCHWFLVDVRTTRGVSRPGIYKGEIAITSPSSRTALPLEVEVLPVDMLTMDEAGLAMGGCVSGLVPAHDIAFQSSWNQNGFNLWWFGVQPEMTLKEGKLQIDWTYLDEWMAAAKARGMKSAVWFLGGNPYGFPGTMTLQRTLYSVIGKGNNHAFIRAQADEQARDRMLPEVRPYYVEFFRQLHAHMVAAQWPEIIVTPFDEPAKWTQGPGRKDGSTNPDVIGTGPWIKSYFKDSCAAIREGAPELRIYASIHHNRPGKQEGIVFVDDVDVFCTNAIGEDPELGDKVRARRKTFWQYSGFSRGASDARFAFGFFFAAFDSRGSLCWAYNWGNGFEIPKDGNSWIYGWQTPFDTIPSPYFVNLREGWDDRRTIETYRKTFAGDKTALAELDAILQEAAGSRSAGGRDTVNDFWAGVDDAAKLDRWRHALLDRLAGSARRSRRALRT